MKRLALVVSHPIQYHSPLYRALADQLELHVFFLSDHGVEDTHDPGFDRSIRYDTDLLSGFRHTFISNVSPVADLTPPFGQVNPGLVRGIRKFKPDATLVHGYAYLSNMLALALPSSITGAKLLRGEARLDTSKTARKLPKATREVFLRALLGRVDAALSIGSANSAFYRHYGFPPSRIFSVPYAVDNDFFGRSAQAAQGDRANLLTQLGLDPSLPVVTFAGKMQEWKRPVDVVEGWKRSAKESSLLMIGDGPERPKVLDLLVPDGRSWAAPGFLNQGNLAQALGLTDVLVVPSSHEPWGLIVNEALAAGASIICTHNVGAARDLISESVGVVIGGEDVVGGIADALDNLLHGAPMPPSRRAKCRSAVSSHSIEAAAAGILRAVEAFS